VDVKRNMLDLARRGEPNPVLLAKIGRMAVRRLGEALDPTGLKPRHIAAMTALREQPSSQSALSEATGVDAAKLVGVLNDLESEGLVTRKRDKADRRRHTVELSELGRARLAGVDAAVRAVENELFAGLDAAQRAYLGALLVHIAENASSGPCDAEEIAQPL
jgi:DNA-binding MarR family transcriptional regulator